MKPLISVVMPVYNNAQDVGLAIQSILDQTFNNFEFIIVDDGSSDGTLSVLRAYARCDSRIKIYTNKKNQQIARSLNRGVFLASTDIIARMDADDISFPERLAKQYQFLKKHPKVGVVGANMLIMDKSGQIISKREYPQDSKRLKEIIFRYSPFAHPAVCFRKRVFEEFGGYDSSKVPCEDIDLWFRIGTRYDFANIPEFLLKYRLIIRSNSHRSLKHLELLGLQIKLDAIRNFGYRPSFSDLIYNLCQYATLWFMPPYLRIQTYDFLRSRGII
jgi:glycosyltransferase involved in cell wall biosynthesis